MIETDVVDIPEEIVEHTERDKKIGDLISRLKQQVGLSGGANSNECVVSVVETTRCVTIHNKGIKDYFSSVKPTDQLKANLKLIVESYLLVDKNITDITKLLTPLRNDKKQFEAYILDVMGMTKKEHVQHEEAILSKQVKQNRATLTEKTLIDSLTTELGGDKDVAVELVKRIMDGVQVNEKVVLKKTKNS